MEEENTLPLSVSDDIDTALDKAIEKANAAESEAQESSEVSAEVEKPEDLPEPPAEFNPKEREAWEKGDRKGIREGWDRVNRARQEELHATKDEHRVYRELVTRIKPHIEAAGYRGKAAESVLIEAVTLLSEAQKDPYAVADQIAKARGITRGEQQTNNESETNPSLIALQNEVQALKIEREREVNERAATQLGSIYQSLQSEITENGNLKYPGLDNDELAVNVGSLIRSADFQRAVLSRVPNAGPKELIIEAYKWYGGAVADSNGVKSLGSNNNANHIDRARKASLSQPGRSVPGNKNTAARKYSSLDDALDAAINDLK